MAAGFLLLLSRRFCRNMVCRSAQATHFKKWRVSRLRTGGDTWNAVSRISAVGEKASFGLRGEYRSVEDLKGAFFEVKCNYGILANAEGVDSSGHWRQDNSGQIHPLDSAEAREVAVTEAPA
jgi:hypothetical protein